MFETLMFLSPPITFVLFPLKKQLEKDMSFTCELPSPFPHDVLSVYIATGFWQLKTEFENLIFSMATPLRRLYVLSMHIPVLVLLTMTFVIAQFLIIPLPTPILKALQRLVESMQLDIVMFSQTLSFFWSFSPWHLIAMQSSSVSIMQSEMQTLEQASMSRPSLLCPRWSFLITIFEIMTSRQPKNMSDQ